MVFARRAKMQLLAFIVISVSALSMIAIDYLKVPERLGIGRYSITVLMSDASGLHESTLVTLRGAPVGKVSRIDIADRGVRVRLDLSDGVRVPVSTRVQVHSASAAGEQYVDLIPPTGGPPYLSSGGILTADHVTPLQSTGELVDSATRLAASVDPKEVETVLRELAAGLDGSAENWRRLVASSLTVTHGVRANLGSTTGLLDGLAGFLRTQDAVVPDLTAAAHGLDSVTRVVRTSQPDLATILDNGGTTLDAVSAVVQENAGDLGLLLHDLASTGQVVKTYLPGVEQVLVIYPATISSLIAATTPAGGAAPGSVHLGFRANVNQPPQCTDGFLPIKDERAYGDYTTRTPMLANLYCHASPDDPRDVRGARNYPCLNAPGRRAASVEECLGRPIGSLKDPLALADRAGTGTYRPDTSRVLTGDGLTFLLGSSFGLDGQKGQVPSWRSLVLP